MRTEYRKKLRNRVILFCVSFAVLLSALIGSLGYYLYKTNIEKSYQNHANTLISHISSEIDAVDLQDCIKGGGVTEGFKELQQICNNIEENSDAMYVYLIYYPDGVEAGTIAYAINGDTKYELETEGDVIYHLGEIADESDFSPEMRLKFKKSVNNKDKRIHFLDHTLYIEADDMNTTEYVNTAFVPIWTEEKELVGILCIDMSMTEMHGDLQYYLITIVVGTLGVLIVFLLIFILVMNKNVITPIKRIAESAENFVKQSYSVSEPSEFSFHEVNVKTRDEIELLSDSLNHMVHEVIRYMVEMKSMTGERERLAAEMNVAKQIQLNLYPCMFPAFPERSEFDIYAKLELAQEGGGDFYNFFFIDSNHLCVIIGSVSGVGIPTTMFAAISSTLMKNYAQLGYTPGRVFAETNNQISKSNRAELNVLAFMGIIDLSTGRMEYTSAGELVPLIKKSGQKFEEMTNRKGIRMGSMENIPYFQQSITLVQGDMLFLYTSGISEAMDDRGNEYSDTYVREKMDEITKQEIELEKMIQSLSNDVTQFRDKAVQQKDYTMLLVRYYGQ